VTTDNRQQALAYHAGKPAGKIGIALTKACETQADLSLAYTPGVAEPVREIYRDPTLARTYTNKGNLVAVITDGSAVLGLGNQGALAAKPVMEGKAVLFKKFADIDVFDIEVNAQSIDEFIQTVINISPGFGGINLEDIKAPECFEIEQRLIEALDIPVFHDDQHGTAIIIAAGLLNALELQAKQLSESKIVIIGAGAAAVASAQLLLELGANPQSLRMLDRQGVIHTEREHLHPTKQKFAVETEERSLEDAMADADVMIGVSAANLVTADMVATMAAKPVIFALSNPDPEIHPELARQTRPDAIIATGRSDFPNQVNNVLGFPFIFRGALDAGARQITPAMKAAAVYGLRDLARQPVLAEVQAVYPNEVLEFGASCIVPKPLDPRLRDYVAEAVRRAALATT
jgi:malate dehydrogenase (oxaloacetate-decarboxylating)(NADP+)